MASLLVKYGANRELDAHSEPLNVYLVCAMRNFDGLEEFQILDSIYETPTELAERLNVDLFFSIEEESAMKRKLLTSLPNLSYCDVIVRLRE